MKTVYVAKEKMKAGYAMKKLLSFFASAICVALLTGCLVSEYPETPANNKELSYSTGKGLFVSETLQLSDNIQIQGMTPSGSSLIIFGTNEKEEYNVFRVDLETGSSYKLQGLDNLYISGIDSYSNGDAILLTIGEDGSDNILIIHPDDSIEKIEFEVSETLEQESIKSAHIVKNGFLLETGYSVIALDKTGVIIRELSYKPKQLRIVHSAKDEAIILASDTTGTEINILDEHFQISEKYRFPETYSEFFSSEEDNIYALGPNTVYRLDYRNGERTNYANTFISGMWSSNYVFLPTGSIYTSSMGKLTKWTPSENHEVTVLKLATYNPSFYIPLIVSEYNNSTADYKIEIMDYAVYDNADNPDQGINKLHLDIVSGECPDIFDLSSFYPNFYSSKGILEDLKPWFESDQNIGLEDLNESLVSLLEYKDGLYELVPCYDIYTLCGDGSTVGYSGSFTLDEFFELEKEYGLRALLGEHITRTDFLYWYIVFEKNLVDYSNATSKFNEDNFIRILQLSASLPDAIESYENNMWGELFSGTQLLALTNMDSDPIGTVTYLDAIFSDNAQFVGFPTENGTGTVISPNIRLAMSSDSQYKQEVWAFFKYLLDDKNQSDTKNYPGFPAVEKQLQARLDKWVVPYQNGNMNLYTSYNGAALEIPGRKVDKVTEQKVIDIYKSTDGFAMIDQNILNIVFQKVEAFYAGDKSAEETAELIQSRIDIYLSEQYG